LAFNKNNSGGRTLIHKLFKTLYNTLYCTSRSQRKISHFVVVLNHRRSEYDLAPKSQNVYRVTELN